MRIAVNGMGRIGRLLSRRLLDQEGMELVAVNDIMDTDNLAYLLRYDSVYGTLPAPVAHRDGVLTVGDQKIAVFRQEDPARLPWKDLMADILIECTVTFSRLAGAGIHLTSVSKKHLLS